VPRYRDPRAAQTLARLLGAYSVDAKAVAEQLNKDTTEGLAAALAALAGSFSSGSRRR
jgi:hypothetical protein